MAASPRPLLDVSGLTDTRCSISISVSVQYMGPSGPIFNSEERMRRPGILVLLCSIFFATGCASGQLVCEWQTEDEQFEELIRQTIEAVSAEEE